MNQIMDAAELMETMQDMIRIGSNLPDIPMYELSPDEKVFLNRVVLGKRVVIVGVPGAFTPECHTVHLPGYVNNADTLKKQGIDEIFCIAVNDPFVMKAWSDKLKASGKVRFLADTSATFTLAIGLACDLPVLGGVRSRRYSMVLYNGIVVHLKVEVDTTSLKCSLVEALEFPNMKVG
ncbi:unnamed protein product [Acanthoscelides obtectus]|uniref:Peroxiredoxin-5 n=1 Tax=Acanthoscelides obtectus TaxID=200917 RepID=A0A9P0Q2Z3_ACAOB|nr:unnamed protein product [Acanthoscelides obtectus]CAK1619807.1 Peroxiredoxin-5, mitochondrial [Acanthoscelides obtectus]